MTDERLDWIAGASAAIRPLGPADLPGCLRLAADRGWNPDDRRWQRLIDAGALYGVTDPGGEVAASVAVTRYGDALAIIGMMLVASRYGRQGLGRQLMTYALDAAGDRTVFLYATRYGRPLYEQLGFVTRSRITTYRGHVRARPGRGAPRSTGSRPAAEGDLEAVVATDAEVFGADRADLIGWLFTAAHQVRVTERGQALTGYAAATGNQDETTLGPVIAADAATAEVLIADLAAAVDGPLPFRLDLDERDAELTAWAAQHGLSPTSSMSLMVHDGRALPGDRSRLFAPVGPAFG